MGNRFLLQEKAFWAPAFQPRKKERRPILRIALTGVFVDDEPAAMDPYDSMSCASRIAEKSSGLMA